MMTQAEIVKYFTYKFGRDFVLHAHKETGLSRKTLTKVRDGGRVTLSTIAKLTLHIESNPIEPEADVPAWLCGAEQVPGGWRGHAMNTELGLTAIVERRDGYERDSILYRGTEKTSAKGWEERAKEEARAAIDRAAKDVRQGMSGAGVRLVNNIESLGEIAPGRLVKGISDIVERLDESGDLDTQIERTMAFIFGRVAADTKCKDLESPDILGRAIESHLKEEFDHVARSVSPRELLDTGLGGADGTTALKIEGLRRLENLLFSERYIKNQYVRERAARLRDEITEAMESGEERERIESLVDDVLCSPDAHKFHDETAPQLLKKGVCRGLKLEYIESLPVETLNALQHLNHAEQLTAAGGLEVRKLAMEKAMSRLTRVAGVDLHALLEAMKKLRHSDLAPLAARELKRSRR